MEADAPDYPVSRVIVSYDAIGILRLHVPDDHVESLEETLTTQVEEVTGDDDEVVFTVDIGDPGAQRLESHANDLLSNQPMVGLAAIDLGESQAHAIDLHVSEDDLKQIIMETPRDLPEDETVTHEFSLRPKSAWVTVHQLRAALDGSEDPVDDIDMQDVRKTIPSQ